MITCLENTEISGKYQGILELLIKSEKCQGISCHGKLSCVSVF